MLSTSAFHGHNATFEDPPGVIVSVIRASPTPVQYFVQMAKIGGGFFDESFVRRRFDERKTVFTKIHVGQGRRGRIAIGEMKKISHLG
jgi:hypothetical protein